MLHTRIELELAVGLEIGAECPRRVEVDARIDVFDRAVGEEAADLEGADAVELAIFGFDRRQDAGVEVRRQRQVAVGRDLPVIGNGELEALLASKR